MPDTVLCFFINYIYKFFTYVIVIAMKQVIPKQIHLETNNIYSLT